MPKPTERKPDTAETVRDDQSALVLASVRPAPAYRFKDGLGYKLSRAAKVFQAEAENTLKPFGINRLSWVVLASIRFDGFDAPGAIARHIGIERTLVSRMLTQLEADGLVARRTNKEDRRGYRIVLTNAGIDLCDTIPRHIRHALEPLRARLTPEQLLLLTDMLDILSDTQDPVWLSDDP